MSKQKLLWLASFLHKKKKFDQKNCSHVMMIGAQTYATYKVDGHDD